MPRKKIQTGSIEEQQKAKLSSRILQIRQTLFDDNNRIYSQQICVNEQALSQICSGKRNAGIEIVQRILEKIPSISPDWLLLGKGEMLRPDEANGGVLGTQNPKFYEKIIADLQDLIARQRDEISELKANVEKERKKTASFSVKTTVEHI